MAGSVLSLLANTLFGAGCAYAAQPSAPSPVAAPLRDLPWAQLNFLHSTDTHGWHAGHLQEPFYSSDWGDYISFAQHLRHKADAEGVDLLLVDTGDRVEGNGLYDASDPKGRYTSNVFKEQHIDVICSGNHELYKEHTADNEYLTTVPNFHENYIASNIDIFDPESGKRVPLAQRYRIFTTKNLGIRILAFGFLFDFTGNYNNTIVQPVEETVIEPWFQKVMDGEDVDLVLVVGHVALRSEEHAAILKTIQTAKPHVPIQFFGGHTHIRDFARYDSSSTALESGRYMETIGFLSIDGISGSKATKVEDGLEFRRRYIDNNLFSYYHHTGTNASTFPTEHGQQVSSSIAHARAALDLDKVYGCAPHDYWLSRVRYPSNQSLFTWMEEQVLPDMVRDESRADKAGFVISNTGSLRFDIFKGPFTRDSTYIVSPFESKFRYIKDVSYDKARLVLDLLNGGDHIFNQEAPELQESLDLLEHRYRLVNDVQDNDLYTYDKQSDLAGHHTSRPNLFPGYTTEDDDGHDGDDTLHSPIPSYRVPNCIQAEIGFPKNGQNPSEVDLVFVDFIEPWILLALTFTGTQFDAHQIKYYAGEKTMTAMMSEWIEKNWAEHC